VKTNYQPTQANPNQIEIDALWQQFNQTQAALDETRLLYETSQRISAALDVDEVIAAYLQQVATQGQYACNVVLYHFDDAGERVSVVVCGRWTPAEGLCCPLREQIRHTPDALDPLLDAGQTITIDDTQTDPRVPAELRQIQLRDKRPALALIPLMVDNRRIGLVILSYAAVHAWQPSDLHPYQVTATLLAAAINNRRQQQLLYQRGQQLAVLEERQRLARELHDSVTQLIFSITLIAQSLAPAWQRNPAEGEHRVRHLLELSQTALAEMRTLLAELRPSVSTPAVEMNPSVLSGLDVVRQQGLVAALNWHFATVGGELLPIKLDATGYQPQSSVQEEALYRITQEAVNNAIKHARAGQVVVKLTTQAQVTQLAISDDGLGFDISTVNGLSALPEQKAGNDKQLNGFGLISMQERARALGGGVNLTTAPGNGTTVTVTIPHQQE
jgi:signal transduction histidine kinase